MPDNLSSLSPQIDAVAATPSHRRLSFLDAVRGVAAVAVLVQHFGMNGFAGFPALEMHFDFGQFGVVAFFLVSGFIIPVSLEKYGKLGPFWKARFFRLYPMYWVSLALALVITAMGMHGLEPAFHVHPVLTVAANVTMLQRFFGLPDAVVVYWTLGLEMAFYGICSVLVWRRWMRSPVTIAVVVALAVAMVDNAIAFGLHRSPLAMHFGLVVSAFVGSVAYRVYQGEVKVKALMPLVALVFAVFAEGFWLHYSKLPVIDGKPHDSAVGMLITWAAAYAFFFLMFALRGVQFPRWLQWLGQISYSLYLLHLLMWDVVVHIAPVSGGVCTGLATVITVGLSHLTYTYVERPAIKLGRA